MSTKKTKKVVDIKEYMLKKQREEAIKRINAAADKLKW